MKYSKMQVAKALMADSSIFVHLDARRSGVLLPKKLMPKAQVVLQIGNDMPVPIADLNIGTDGISGTLSFQGNHREFKFYCEVPWDAIFALVNESANGYTWKEDMPYELNMSAAAPMALSLGDINIPAEQIATVTSLCEYRAQRKAQEV